MSDHATNSTPDIIELEMDFATTSAPAAADEPDIAIELDMACLGCGAIRPLNERSLCRFCAGPRPSAPANANAPEAETSTLLGSLEQIAGEGTANANVAGAGSMAGGQLAGVGFTSREGYLTAIRNGVPAHTHASYLETLRTRYGMTAAELAALPGAMAATALPEGPGIVHTPTGPSIFDRPRAERAFVLGPAAVPTVSAEPPPNVTLVPGQLVAGAVADGHGVLLGWRGDGQLTRGDLLGALDAIGMAGATPETTSARAQAGRAVVALNATGYIVRTERRASGATAGVSRWTVGSAHHTGNVGDTFGTTVLIVTLAGTTLSVDGDQQLGRRVLEAYNAAIATEVYQAADITAWLGRTLRARYDAVRFGVGWYVPARHAAAAGQLCEAVSAIGWGADWIVPALPVATSDQLRDGIVRGLTMEVAQLLGRLEAARAAARETRQSGDIGAKRAESYLVDLRHIGARIVAYGQVLGEERVATAREAVRSAVGELEAVLGDEHTGISARFAAVWEEIAMDRSRSGGVL